MFISRGIKSYPGERKNIYLSMLIRISSLTNQDFHGSCHRWMLLLHTWGGFENPGINNVLFEAHPSNRGGGWDPYWDPW